MLDRRRGKNVYKSIWKNDTVRLLITGQVDNFKSKWPSGRNKIQANLNMSAAASASGGCLFWMKFGNPLWVLILWSPRLVFFGVVFFWRGGLGSHCVGHWSLQGPLISPGSPGCPLICFDQARILDLYSESG